MLRQVVTIIAVLGGLICAHSTATETRPSRQEGAMRIPRGTFEALYSTTNGKNIAVQPFAIDPLPVSNAEFFAFTQRFPEWRKEKAPQIFVDSTYLALWAISPLEDKANNIATASPIQAILDTPVVYVSWFAAQAFCEAQNGRLPTTEEWEYVAAADERKTNAMKEQAFNQQILLWYAEPASPLGPGKIAQQRPNIYGIRDLHGLIWEWTSDFNASFATADNREQGALSGQAFCGAAAINSTDKSNYAAFMRYAMRSSLKAAYGLSLLGFRCAYDTNTTEKHP